MGEAARKSRSIRSIDPKKGLHAIKGEFQYCDAIVAANTSMRPVEVKHLRRRDVDLVRKLLFVRRSKNESSHRVIPLNGSALNALARMFERADMLGHTAPEHYLWPACQWGRFDATKPMLKRDTAWRALRDAADLHGLRFHDLRHTIITELAEIGRGDPNVRVVLQHPARQVAGDRFEDVDDRRGLRRPHVTVTSQFDFERVPASR